MNLTFQLLLFGHLRMNIIMFIFAGVVAYFFDYRFIKNDPTLAREATLVKWASRIFVIGGVVLLVLYQCIIIFV